MARIMDRDTLAQAARLPHIGLALLQAAQEVGAFEELPSPTRNDAARTAIFERETTTSGSSEASP